MVDYSLVYWSPTRPSTPNRPTKIVPTKIVPAKIRWLKISGKLPTDMRIPPLKIKIMLESNPLKSRILVRRLAISAWARAGAGAWAGAVDSKSGVLRDLKISVSKSDQLLEGKGR